MLAITHPPVLPSAMLNGVGTPVAIISQLDTRPACTPVNASMAALRLATHDSGPGWFAKPFLYDSSIHYSTPVYPGALRILLDLDQRISGSAKVSSCSSQAAVSNFSAHRQSSARQGLLFVQPELQRPPTL